MKKNLLLLVFGFFALVVNAQHQNPTRLDQVPYGSEINVTLENNSSNNISFLPLFKNYSGIPEDVLRDEQSIVQWLADTCVGINPDDCIMAMSHRLVRLLKNDAFINSALYPDFWKQNDQVAQEQAFAKDHSMIGVLSGTYTMQCGNYAQIAATLFYKTGLVDTSRLRVISIPNQHVFLEIFHNNKWKIVDFDPGMPMFMTVNQLSHEELRFLGFQNTLDQEFQNYGYVSHITGEDDFLEKLGFVDIDSMSTLMNWQKYYADLTNLSGVYPPLFYETYPITGDIILPPGGSLEVHYRNNQMFFDTVQYYQEYQSLSSLLNSGYRAYQTDDFTTLNQVTMQASDILSNILGISQSEAINLLMSQGLRSSNKFVPNLSRDQIPFYTLVIPPGNYQMGIDVKAPGKVLSVELASGQVLLQDSYGNDTLIQQSYEVDFWEPYTDTSRLIPSKANHYLDHGVINSSDTVKIKVSWNPVLFPFVHSELNIDYQGGADTLSHHYLINGVGFNDIVLSQHNPLVSNISIYPNPTTGDLFLSEKSDVKIFSLLGEELVSKRQTFFVDTAHLPSGTYIIQLGNVRKKIVKQ
jgi:hypothetical protein